MSVEDQRTSCPGFLDEYGIWNNGFECPPLPNQIRICCGSDSRRYCCTLGTVRTRLITDSMTSTTIKSSLLMIEKFISIRFILPILFSCLCIFILIWIIRWHCSRRHRRERAKKSVEEHSSGKQSLLVDHFPFSPPHHQFYFNETTNPSTSLPPPPPPLPRDTLTRTTLVPSTLASTSSASTSSVRVPSEIYFHDWKEFFVPTEQPLNIYPQHSYRFHDYCDQDDIIV